MVFEVGTFSATLSVGGDRFTSELAARVDRFDERFENTFQLKAKVEHCILSHVHIITRRCISVHSLFEGFSRLGNQLC